MRLVRFLLLGTVLTAMLTLAQAQPPGGGGPPGGDRGDRGSRGGRGGFGGSPDEMFDRIAKGQPTIDLKTNPFMKSMIERSGDPIPANGLVTREQFKASWEKRMAQGGGRGGPPGGDRGSRGGFGGPPAVGLGGPPTTPGSDPGSDWVTNLFKQADRNQDGYITMDEASDRIKPVFSQYDANGDGKIDVTEYKNGLTNSMASRAPQPGAPGGPPQSGSPPSTDSSRDRSRDRNNARVSVSRYGKLPKEAPSFFTDMDDDRDGMVGLYEWRRHERKTAEFVEMDLNRDGYLTADEWLRYNRIDIEKRDRMSEDDDGTTPRSPGSSRSASTDKGSDRSKSGGSDKSGTDSGGKDSKGKSKGGRGKGSDGENPFIKRKK
jgi:hypothetical protein